VNASFLVIPQWQGSGSSRAMRLVDGAEAIRGDLPSASTTVVDIPLEAGDSRGSALPRLGSLGIVRDRTREALAALPGRVLTIGGDCGVELGSIGHVLEREAGDVAVVWFDAHPDLNTTESSPSGAFSGMIVRTLLGDGVDELVPAVPLAPGNLILSATRSVDDDEAEYLAATGIVGLGVDALTPESLIAAIEATGAASVYLHVDLDALDPSEIAGLSDPVPFGLESGALVALIRAVTGRFEIAGAGVTGYSPASESDVTDDLPTILRIIGALSS